MQLYVKTPLQVNRCGNKHVLCVCVCVHVCARTCGESQESCMSSASWLQQPHSQYCSEKAHCDKKMMQVNVCVNKRCSEERNTNLIRKLQTFSGCEGFLLVLTTSNVCVRVKIWF